MSGDSEKQRPVELSADDWKHIAYVLHWSVDRQENSASSRESGRRIIAYCEAMAAWIQEGQQSS